MTRPVPLQQWKRETSVLGRRSKEMRAIDEVYDVYYKTESDRSAEALFKLLDRYLTDHGGFWGSVSRNAKTGLMESVYNRVREQTEKAPHAIRRHGKEGNLARLSTTPAGKAALDAEAAHARLGVLYLFANTDVATQHLKVLLEGGFGVLGAAGSVIPAGSVGSGAITAGGNAASAGAGYLRGTNTAKELPGHVVRSQPPFQSIRAAAPAPTWVPIDQVSHFNPMSVPGAIRAGRAWMEFIDFLYRKLSEFLDWTIGKIQANEGTAIQLSGTAAKAIINAAVEYVAKAAAPIVGAAIDIGKGVAEVISAVKDRITAALLRSRFQIQPGHPELLANSIQSAMNWAIGKGVWSTMKGAGKLSLTFVSAGASAIGDVIAAACEFITKTVVRLIEAKRLKAFLADAKKLYSKDLDQKPGSIVNDVEAFTRFYEKGCSASPCVPMLTLNSGICGDLMQLMRMFDDTTASKQVSQRMFDSGAEYFSNLKTYGRDYIQNSGFTFRSSSNVVQGLLSHAVSHHDPKSLSKADAALAFLKG